MVTLDKILTWSDVTVAKTTAQEFNEQRRWLKAQGQRVAHDFLYYPSTPISGKGMDGYKFKDASVATLFKLTFG